MTRVEPFDLMFAGRSNCVLCFSTVSWPRFIGHRVNWSGPHRPIYIAPSNASFRDRRQARCRRR